MGGERIPLSEQQFTDLITVHLADWLEQVRPMPRSVSLAALYAGRCSGVRTTYLGESKP